MTWVQPPAPCPAHEQHPGEVSSPLCRGWGSIFKITPPAPLSVVLALVCDVADVPDLVPHTWAISALGTPPPIPQSLSLQGRIHLSQSSKVREE